jgi:hypothetical protein
MQTRHAAAAVLGACLFPALVAAQGTDPSPVAEVGVRYAYNSLLISDTGESNQSGGSVYGQYFFKRSAQKWQGTSRFSLVADFTASGSGSGRLSTYMFGPRFSTEWRKSHLVLHGEYKIGGAHARVNGVTPAGSEVSLVKNGFALGIAAVGLDLLIKRHYVVTLIQSESALTQVPDLTSGTARWRGDTRVSAGLGFRFGGTH